MLKSPKLRAKAVRRTTPPTGTPPCPVVMGGYLATAGVLVVELGLVRVGDDVARTRRGVRVEIDAWLSAERRLALGGQTAEAEARVPVGRVNS